MRLIRLKRLSFVVTLEPKQGKDSSYCCGIYPDKIRYDRDDPRKPILESFPYLVFGSRPLYSLEKPIEWKRFVDCIQDNTHVPLYSLEKPIEWKPVSAYWNQVRSKLSTR